ncbi:MAG TPA: rod shape-determining protein MreD [Candidatus Aminicenantes bacterium]|nr:MAG: rod shape-determining protein MreD [Candidatus Aminicenantes bacterium]HEK86318.1 rod shape-determining protein MreD [Candidatus Aminicenantes bacterium]
MVRKGLVLFLGLVLAAAFYSLLGSLNPVLVLLINAWAILVFFSALIYGEIEGAVMGTIAGLLQDAFSHSIFGLAGLSLTIAGFLLGWTSQKVNLNTFYKKIIFLFFFSLLQLIIWVIFYYFIFKKSLLYSRPEIYLQPVATTLITAALITFFHKLKTTG